MTPSERIHLIRNVSQTFEDEEYDFIDLVLRQFGAPTSMTWEGSKRGYVLAMLERADDAVLQDIGGHFGLLASEANVPAAFSGWEPNHLRVFISHLSADQEKATKLRDALKPFSIDSFVAQLTIEPTRQWQDEIELALRSSHALIALMTPEFASSEWADQEIGIAIGRGILVVPLLAGKNPYGFIGRYQGLPAKGRTAKAVAEDLVKVFVKNPLTAPHMAEILVGRFEQVGSWEAARTELALIEQLPRIEQPLLQRVIDAEKSNPEISHSHGVPARIAALVAAHRT